MVGTRFLLTLALICCATFMLVQCSSHASAAMQFPAPTVPSLFTWSYTAPLDEVNWWPKWFPNCVGTHQSPIDVVSADVVPSATTLSIKATASKYMYSIDGITGLFNLFHTLRSDVWMQNYRMELKWDGTGADDAVDGTYLLHHVTVRVPSEHKIDGVAYDGEVQYTLTSIDPQYLDSTTAPTQAIQNTYESGMSVTFSQLFEVDTALSNSTRSLNALSAMLVSMAETSENTIGKVTFSFPDFSSGAMAYVGSQTYPPCRAGVRFFIANSIAKVSSSAYAIVEDTMPSTPAVRSVQPLESDRKVYSISVTQNNVDKQFPTTAAETTFQLHFDAVYVRADLLKAGVEMVGVLGAFFLLLIFASIAERVWYSSPYRILWMRPSKRTCVFGTDGVGEANGVADNGTDLRPTKEDPQRVKYFSQRMTPRSTRQNSQQEHVLWSDQLVKNFPDNPRNSPRSDEAVYEGIFQGHVGDVEMQRIDRNKKNQ